MIENAETRRRRLRMRSWRRGMKEMDLILGPFSDTCLDGMNAGDTDLYDALLSENDQDLYAWITGAARRPERFCDLLGRIADFAADPMRGGRPFGRALTPARRAQQQ